MPRHLLLRLIVTTWVFLGCGLSLVSAPAPVFREKLDPRVMTNSIGMKLVCVPPGEFTMGTPMGEADRSDDEGVLRRVKIPPAFYMGVYEVTQDEYRTGIGTTVARTTAGFAWSSILPRPPNDPRRLSEKMKEAVFRCGNLLR